MPLLCLQIRAPFWGTGAEGFNMQFRGDTIQPLIPRSSGESKELSGDQRPLRYRQSKAPHTIIATKSLPLLHSLCTWSWLFLQPVSYHHQFTCASLCWALCHYKGVEKYNVHQGLSGTLFYRKPTQKKLNPWHICTNWHTCIAEVVTPSWWAIITSWLLFKMLWRT